MCVRLYRYISAWPLCCLPDFVTLPPHLRLTHGPEGLLSLKWCGYSDLGAAAGLKNWKERLVSFSMKSQDGYHATDVVMTLPSISDAFDD